MDTNEAGKKKMILNKFRKISDLEKQIWETVNRFNFKVQDKYFINSQIYACTDGFVLIRYFNLMANSFSIIPINERINLFKKNIPIYSVDNNRYNFPFNLGIGGSVSMGLNSENGITKINNIDFPSFQLKIESNMNLISFAEELEELIVFFEQERTVKEANEKIESLFVENAGLKSRLETFHNPLIITEGKTDWRHIIRALKYFHSKGEYVNIKDDFFLKYGSREDVTNKICGSDFEETFTNSKLVTYLTSTIDNRRLEKGIDKSFRIGVFDSDGEKIKLSNDSESNVFSFKIEPENISTEFLYSDDEIKTFIKNRRLYIGSEFDDKSKRHLTENINLGGDNNSINKSGKRVIVDKDVFKGLDENIALSKSDFSVAVFNNEIEISINSWENFRHIFEKIEKIINSVS